MISQIEGWQSLLQHLNATKLAYGPLASWLETWRPEFDSKTAKRLAERIRRGTALREADLAMLDADILPSLLTLLNRLATEYQTDLGAKDDERRLVARLKKSIPTIELHRLTLLRELANGKALSGPDLSQAQLRTEAAVRAWLAMTDDDRRAWFERVESDLAARDRRRPHGEPPLISTQYRRLFMGPKRQVATSDDFRILGLAAGASAIEIKQAYRRLAMRLHPDHQGDPVAFMTVHQAYERLTKKP